MEEPPPGGYKRGDPRRLEPSDVDGFLDAADERVPEAILQLQALVSELAVKYPVRCHRMSKDLQWALKQARRHDVRWRKG